MIYDLIQIVFHMMRMKKILTMWRMQISQIISYQVRSVKIISYLIV